MAAGDFIDVSCHYNQMRWQYKSTTCNFSKWAFHNFLTVFDNESKRKCGYLVHQPKFYCTTLLRLSKY